MKTEIRSAIIVFVVIGVIVAGASIYFNSIQTSRSVAFQPALINESGTATRIDKSKFELAPELQGISGYINTDPINMTELRGKVVVVDFWTYSCINCIRTIPYLNAWYEKYANDGLVILGVHSPEFEFEKDYNNVKAVVEKFGIKYPVVQDNEMVTWKAFKNNYWPHKYIIDHEGYIRYDHVGEGSYSETESVIQELLRERAATLGIKTSFEQGTVLPTGAVYVNFTKVETPENYLGYAYGGALGNKEKFTQNQATSFAPPSAILPNEVYLEGDWKSNRDNMELVSDTGKVFLGYSARAVNIVAGGESTLTVKINNTPIDKSDYGQDVSDGEVHVSEQRLYNLVMSSDYGSHVIEIDVRGEGFMLYTFTFG